MSGRFRRSHLRDGGEGDHRVNPIELFFDLVFVFAVTQLSHYLLEHHEPAGALQTLVLFLAFWWAWMYTAWATNWLNPDRTPVRLMLFAVMLLGLIMAAVLPGAFAGQGLVFALAYVAIQTGRTLYTAWAKGEWRRGASKNLTRASVYFIASAPLWVAGGLDPDPGRRILWWAAALAIEYAGPLLFFAVPGLGRSRPEEWDISGAHMAERCALVIILSLGEGILVTGATFAGLDKTLPVIFAFLAAFLGSVTLWWLYFDIGAKRGTEVIEHEAHPGMIARQAYTYAHIPIVAGIILMAVFDEQVLAHPVGHLEPFALVSLIGGAFLFIGGNMLFKRLTSGSLWWPLSHVVGLWLFAALGLWGALAHPQPFTLALAATGLLIVIAVWEWGSFHGGWQERWERVRTRLNRTPSPF